MSMSDKIEIDKKVIGSFPITTYTKNQMKEFLSFASKQLTNPKTSEPYEDIAVWNFINICIQKLEDTKIDELNKALKDAQKSQQQSELKVEDLKSKFDMALNDVTLQKIVLEREVNDLKTQLKESQTSNSKLQNKLASTIIANEKLEAKLNNNISPKKGR